MASPAFCPVIAEGLLGLAPFEALYFCFKTFSLYFCHAARLIDPDLRSERLTRSVNARHTSFRAGAGASFSQWTGFLHLPASLRLRSRESRTDSGDIRSGKRQYSAFPSEVVRLVQTCGKVEQASSCHELYLCVWLHCRSERRLLCELTLRARPSHGCDKDKLCNWKLSSFACGSQSSWAMRSPAGGCAGSAAGDEVGSVFT